MSERYLRVLDRLKMSEKNISDCIIVVKRKKKRRGIKSMTYEEYKEKYSKQDHLLVKLTSTFPYFKEKYIVKNGKEYTETNYHIADGMFSTYINYETESSLESNSTISKQI